MISPKTSLLVSAFSGMGLLALVTIAPVEEQYDSAAPFENIQWEIQEAEKNAGKSESLAKKFRREEQQSFNLLIPSFSKTNDRSFSSWERPFLEPASTFHSSGKRGFEPFGQRSDLTSMQAEKEGILVRGQLLSGSLGALNSSYLERRDSGLWDKNSDKLSQTRRLESFEVSVPLSSQFKAVVVGANSEFVGDRVKDQRNLAMAGVSVRAGDFFQTRVLTGDLTTTSGSQAGLGNTPLNFNRPQDISRREDIQRLYEWQASFTPSEYVRLQTSLYNQRNETTYSTSNPDGGKVSISLGGKQIQVNVGYNYLANRREIGTFNGNSFNPSQDLASLGFVLFLDKSQNYSVYVGNSFFNVFNDPLNRVRDSSGRSPSTFTASFRGKARETTAYFFNFQNQFFMDGMIPGLPGGMSLQAQQFRGQGRSFYEFATSLGLEITF